MTAGSIASEALRNISSGTTRAALLMVLWALALSGVVGAEFFAVTAILQSASTFRAAGSNVAVMVASGRIDGDACSRMANLPNVQAAGAIRAAPMDLSPDKAPGTIVPTKEVTPGLLRILNTKPGAGAPALGGIFLSQDVAAALGTKAGQTISIGGQKASVGGVFDYPSDGRTAGLGFSILEPVLQSGRFDECWVQIWPQSDEILSLMSGTVADTSDRSNAPVLTQLNTTLGEKFSSQELFDGRLSRYLPIALACIGFGIGFAALWVRRLEFASARHLGVSPFDQSAQALLETAAWDLSGGLIACAVALVIGSQLPLTDEGPILLSSLLSVTTGLVAAGIGGLLAMGLINERHFLRYFQGR